MRLYFLRHAIAHDADANTTDEQRQLTDEGITRTRQTARMLKALGVKPDALYSSPLIRARETADVIRKVLGVEVQERKEVAPGFSIFAVEALTSDLDEDTDVMFVGHEPDFSTTIASLTGARVVLKRGGLARIDIISRQPMLGDLVWLIAPKIFEQLG